MSKVSWATLLDNKVRYKILVSPELLDKVETGEILIFESSEINDSSDIKIDEATTIDTTDDDDSCNPIRSIHSGWLNHSGYKQIDPTWVAVYASMFTYRPSTIQSQPTTGNETMAMPRRTVVVEVFDNDPGLEVEFSLVARYENIVTEDDDATTIREVLMNKAVDRKLKAHNTVRSTQLNLDILNRTGAEVNLLPVKLKDLTWVVR